MLITAAVIAMSVLFVSIRNSNSRIRQEIHNRCVSVESQKTVIREEHQKKLQESLDFLRRHPNGTVDFSRKLILQGISNERAIVEAEKAQPCP